MRFFKRLVQGLFKSFGYEISATSHYNLEEHIPEYTDQQKIIGNGPITIFDVGAHNGQTSHTYNKLFSQASIYAFEPFPQSFDILKKNVEDKENIKVYNVALSNVIGKVKFNVNESSQTNSILSTHIDGADTWGKNLLSTIDTIDIESTTIDKFVEKNTIDKIDILKLDTQGTEYFIIEGAAKTIAKNKIKLIYLEIIIMPTYDGQKYFDEILLLFRANNFHLYNLYNFSHTANGMLRQVDAIFIHESIK
jgi:FkbM family methyltransferase